MIYMNVEKNGNKLHLVLSFQFNFIINAFQKLKLI